MSYFSQYTSNTCAGSGNQLLTKGDKRTGRVYYKVFAGGTYPYSILFSNTVDSTFADGSLCRRNVQGGEWEILEAKVAVCPGAALGEDVESDDAAMAINGRAFSFAPLTFGGETGKKVTPGEFFATDPVELTFEKGDYLCLELTFAGEDIPYHEESQLPVYAWENGLWHYCKHMPFASMVGCARPVEKRIGYMGDSITQGCGTGVNTYTHWNAVLAEKLGPGYAHWNLGIGFGRGSDAATDGAWLYRAKQNDIVTVCYGVNDILHDIRDEAGEAQLKVDLGRIVDCLNRAGVKVVLQTIPPFGYTGEQIGRWHRVNDHIRNVLAQKVALVFDVVPHLCQDAAQPHMSKYGPHPDGAGCAVWAEALYQAIMASDLLK